uniref:Uncharacterized protein n=1 Tax=Mycena chlorophos TaxID=658473 RepID=A0ABQ0M0V6_MYCCL|nr:predicted protein [Mycena chlorophos]
MSGLAILPCQPTDHVLSVQPALGLDLTSIPLAPHRLHFFAYHAYHEGISALPAYSAREREREDSDVAVVLHQRCRCFPHTAIQPSPVAAIQLHKLDALTTRRSSARSSPRTVIVTSMCPSPSSSSTSLYLIGPRMAPTHGLHRMRRRARRTCALPPGQGRTKCRSSIGGGCRIHGGREFLHSGFSREHGWVLVALLRRPFTLHPRGLGRCRWVYGSVEVSIRLLVRVPDCHFCLPATTLRPQPYLRIHFRTTLLYQAHSAFPTSDTTLERADRRRGA